jgi:diacylglycerol kinase (ATP)
MPQEKPSNARLATSRQRIRLSRADTAPIISPLKTRLIINPHSGRVRRALPAVLAFAQQRGYETVFTTRPGHATELAQAALAENCQCVAAVGGDGTMNEVGRALIGTTATFALVPCGSGDGLGRHLGIHGPTTRALAILEQGEPRLIDTGTANGHPFFNVAGLGLEAELAQRFHTTRIRGLTGYLLQSMAALRQSQAEVVHVRHDGQSVSFRTSTLAVANGDQYGNGARIAPGARCDDGALELTGIPPLRWNNLPRLALRLFQGRLDRDRHVLRLTAAQFTVERENAGWIHTDGETHWAAAQLHFRIVRSSLRILCPAL